MGDIRDEGIVSGGIDIEGFDTLSSMLESVNDPLDSLFPTDPSSENKGNEENKVEDKKEDPKPAEDKPKEGEDNPKDPKEDSKPTDPEDKDKKEDKNLSDEEKQKLEEDKYKDVPFNKHPRWKELRKENRELKEFKAQKELEERLAKEREADIAKNKANSDDKEEDLPQDFIDAFGYDLDTWAKVKDKWLGEKPKEEVKKEEEKKVEGPTEEEIKKANDWIDLKLQEVEDEFDTDLTTDQNHRNSFLKFMKDNRLTTQDGKHFDFSKGYKLFTQLNEKEANELKEKEAKELEEKKKIAGNGNKPSSNNSSKSNSPIKNIRNTSWDSL